MAYATTITFGKARYTAPKFLGQSTKGCSVATSAIPFNILTFKALTKSALSSSVTSTLDYVTTGPFTWLYGPTVIASSYRTRVIFLFASASSLSTFSGVRPPSLIFFERSSLQSDN